MAREFLWAGQRLADPGAQYTPEQVRDLYAQVYPELTTAAVRKAEEQHGTEIVAFEKQEPAKPVATGGGSARKESYTFDKSQGKRG